LVCDIQRHPSNEQSQISQSLTIQGTNYYHIQESNLEHKYNYEYNNIYTSQDFIVYNP